MEKQGTPNSQSNLEKKGGSLTLPNLKTYNKGTKIRTVWYYNRDKHTDEKNRIENQEICS